MLSGAAAMPPVPVSMKRGRDDAYETIMSEFFRVEEAARAGGVAHPGGGAISVTGRHLEGFISHLDMQVNPFESSAQVYRELRGFVKKQVRAMQDNVADQADRMLKPQDITDTDEGIIEPDTQDAANLESVSDEPELTATSTNPVS